MAHYKDESIFQNILDFDSPLGKLRAMYGGCQIWSIYVYDEEASSYIHDAKIYCKASAKCKAVYNAYLDSRYEC